MPLVHVSGSVQQFMTVGCLVSKTSVFIVLMSDLRLGVNRNSLITVITWLWWMVFPFCSRGLPFISHLDSLPNFTRSSDGPIRLPIVDKYKVSSFESLSREKQTSGCLFSVLSGWVGAKQMFKRSKSVFLLHTFFIPLPLEFISNKALDFYQTFSPLFFFVAYLYPPCYWNKFTFRKYMTLVLANRIAVAR